MTRQHRTVRRWPSRNFLAELEPALGEPISVEHLAQRSPRLRRLHRSLRAASTNVRSHVPENDWIRFADARSLVGTTEFELAFNLGFEYGFVVGRREAFRRRHAAESTKSDRKLGAMLLAILAQSDSAPAEIVAGLLEVAWAINHGPPDLPRRRPAPRPRPQQRRR